MISVPDSPLGSCDSDSYLCKHRRLGDPDNLTARELRGRSIWVSG